MSAGSEAGGDLIQVSADLEASRQLFQMHGRGRYAGRYFFDQWKRRHLDTLFAFVTYLDDVSDDAKTPSDVRVAHLEQWIAAVAGVTEAPLPMMDQPLFRSLRRVLGFWDIDLREALAYLDGQVEAIGTRTYANHEALRAYLDTVTLVPARWANVMFESSANDSMAQCERVIEAFQLIDFLWDVDEDARSGRLYIPSSELAPYDAQDVIDNWKQLGSERRAVVRSAITRMAQVAAELLEVGDQWAANMDTSSRKFMETDLGLHRDLLRMIREDPDGLIDGRKNVGFLSRRQAVRSARNLAAARSRSTILILKVARSGRK